MMAFRRDDRQQLDELNRSLTAIARIVRRHRTFSQLGKSAGAGIRPNLLLVFAKIAETQPVRVSELAEAMEVDRSTISRQVGELVTSGYVERIPDSADARAHFVALTRAGGVAQREIVKAWRKILGDATVDWTQKERQLLIDHLYRLASEIEKIIVAS